MEETAIFCLILILGRTKQGIPQYSQVIQMVLQVRGILFLQGFPEKKERENVFQNEIFFSKLFCLLAKSFLKNRAPEISILQSI